MQLSGFLLIEMLGVGNCVLCAMPETNRSKFPFLTIPIQLFNPFFLIIALIMDRPR